MTPVMVRLEVEGMRYQVVHAFMQHSNEIEGEIGRATDAALRDFDFVAAVRVEVDRTLRDAVKTAIASAVSSIMYEQSIHDLIADGARSKVRKAIEDSLKGKS